MIVKTLASIAGMIFLLFVIANFIAFFNFTNLATVLAVNLADFLQTVPIGAAGYIVLFVLVVAIIDIILTGALAKWAILAPVFVPLFMRLGGDPNLVLAAYRVGDSPMNVITPLNVYLGGDGRLRAEVPEGRRHRHDRRADAALHRRPARDLDADAGRLERARHPARPGLTPRIRRNRHVRPRQGARPYRRRPRQRARAAVRDAAAQVDLDRSGLCRRDPRLRRVARGRPRARSASTPRCATPPGHPMVVGHLREGDGPSVLFYGHYDVQPVDPLELWEHDPFDPKIVTRADGSKMLAAAAPPTTRAS